MLCARLGAMASYSPSSLSSSYNSSYSRGMMLFQTQERRQKKNINSKPTIKLSQTQTHTHTIGYPINGIATSAGERSSIIKTDI
jgi:hypothetical protein